MVESHQEESKIEKARNSINMLFSDMEIHTQRNL